MRRQKEPVGSRISRRQRTERQVRSLLHEQAGPQWGYLAFLWIFCVVALLLLGRFVLTGCWPCPFVLVWATVLVAAEGWRQHRRIRQVGHARRADPVLVTITGLGPRCVTVQASQGAVQVPSSSTAGLRVGDAIWAAPEPAPGEHVVLVRNRRRPGALDLITPRGPARDA